jgi:demethylphylloquinol methyltransferase
MIRRINKPIPAPEETGSRSYEWISSQYDWTIALCTGGQNLRTRLAQLDDMAPGDRVLYVGVGSGEDAIEAARRGIQVTCLDLSSSMIERARQRFQRAGLTADFVGADLMHYTTEQPFDAVACNFFLNIFSPSVMQEVLTRVVSLVRPGGKLVIADFAPAHQGNAFLRAAHRIYYRAANVAYWTVGLCALHPIYIYADYYPQLGLTLKRTERFRVFARGPWFFQTTTAVKDRWLDAQVVERSRRLATSERSYFAAASAAS